MVRVICGSIYHPLKPWRDVVDNTTADYILSIDGAKVIHQRVVSKEFQYAFFAYPGGGNCLIERFSTSDHLTLTLHFSGSSELYEGEKSLAKRILKSWENNDVTIKRR